MTLIKSDIVDQVSRKLVIDKKTSSQAVECILKIIKTALESGQSIMISGFGNLNIKQKKTRVGRNPKTKEEFQISARTVVTFNPSKVFKKEINQ